MEEKYELTPDTPDKADRAQQRRIIWLFTVAFICVNVLVIFGSLISSEIAANALLIEDTIFWFNMSILAIVSSYFGIDVVANFMSNRTATLRKL